jgi:hypothetical protein
MLYRTPFAFPANFEKISLAGGKRTSATGGNGLAMKSSTPNLRKWTMAASSKDKRDGRHEPHRDEAESDHSAPKQEAAK